LQPKFPVRIYSAGLQHVGSGQLTLVTREPGMQKLIDHAKWYADPQNRNAAVPTEFIKRVLVAAKWAEDDDEVVAVDCRDFHDPDRHSHCKADADANHLGFHHSVMKGLIKNGARVWRPHLHRKVDVPLGDWASEFVLAPLWNAIMKVRKEAGSAARQKNVVMVFFCKWGRHRSVALQTCFLKAMPFVPWLELKNASHLAAHSWLWSTCNFCAVWTLDLYSHYSLSLLFNSQHRVSQFSVGLRFTFYAIRHFIFYDLVTFAFSHSHFVFQHHVKLVSH